MRRLLAAAVLLGLAVYLAAFYATPLPDVHNDKGEPLRRIGLLRQIALLPDDFLLSNWFGSPPQFAWADRLPVLLVAGAILAWAAALGWLLLRIVGGDSRRRLTAERNRRQESPPTTLDLTRLETFVFATAVGLATLSAWVLLMGLLGLLSRTWTFAVPAALTLLAAGWLRYIKPRPVVAPRNATAGRGATRGATTGRGLMPESPDVLPVRWLWLALPFVVAILLAAMLPPTDFDVCEYHLQAPKEFYQQGRITLLPHNVYANMPLGAEMLSLLAMVVAGDWWLGALAGKTVIAAFTPLCALALYSAGRRFLSTSAGVTAALVYVSIPWVASTSIIPSALNVSSSGLVEGALACYLFLAVYALLLGRATLARGASEGREPTPSLALRASVSPAAAGPVRFTHPTGLLLLAGYLAGAAVAVKYPAALMVLLPLCVWVFVGGIVRAAVPAAAKQVTVLLLAAAVACGLWFGKNWVQTGNPTYPLLYGVFDGRTWDAEKDARWNRVHRPHDFSLATLGEDLGRVVLTSPWLSPLVIPLAALAFFPSRRRSKPLAALQWKLLAYAAFVIAVWWLLTHRIDRFWLPVLPVLALMAGAGACWSTERWWQWTLRGLLVAALAANFLLAAAGPGNAWFVPLAKLRNDWSDPWHRWFNARAADGGVLAVGDAAVFDLRPRVLYSTCFDDCIFEQLVKGKTPGEIRAELAARHIAYVYVNWAEIDRYNSPGNYGFTDFVQRGVFDRLVQEGVLGRLPPIKDNRGRAYRVE